MTWTVLRAEITVGAARRFPLHDGYRTQMDFGVRGPGGTAETNDAAIVFEDVEEAHAGETRTARMWVVHSDLIPADVDAGTEFVLVEGASEVAQVRVIEVLIDDDSSPLSDPEASRVRPLRHPER
jgi:hypothetical protein